MAEPFEKPSSNKDFTEKVVIQNKAKENNLLSLVEESIQLGIWDYHIKDGIIHFNQSFLDILELKNDILSERFDFLVEMILADDSKHTLKALNEHINGHSDSFNSEFRIKTGSSRVKWLQMQGKVKEFDSSGMAVRMVGIISDITDLKHSYFQISKSETQVKAFLKLIPDNIFILNRRGIIVDAYFNESKHNRLKCEEILEKNFIDIYDPKLSVEFEVMLSLAIETKKVQNYEFVINDRKESITYECRLLYIDSKSILAIVRDISTERQAAQALRNSETELKKLIETKDRLFSIIGHDLKSPFNNILGFADILWDNFDNLTTEKIKEYLSYIRISTGQAFALFENLLEWSRAQSSKIHSFPVKFDLNNTIDKTIALFSAQLNQKNISIINTSLEAAVVYADPNMISTVFRNIFSNALKFTKPNGSITIVVQKTELETLVSIADTGIGMPQDLVAKLFHINENVSRKGTSGEKGTGLGLLLCKDFMEKNMGDIHVSSIEGLGTTFTLTFKHLPFEEASS